MGRARAGSTRGGGRGSPAHTFTWQAFSEGKQGLGTFPRPPHPAPSTLPPRFSPLGCRSQPGPCHGSCVPILAREHPEPPRLDGGCPRGHREPQPLPEDAAVPPVHGGTRGLGAAPIPSRVVSALSTPAASAKLIYFLHEYGRYKTCKNKLFFPFFFCVPHPFVTLPSPKRAGYLQAEAGGSVAAAALAAGWLLADAALGAVVAAGGAAGAAAWGRNTRVRGGEI